jgi:mono/diheme cytochrome c family protein/nitrate/TMAO reductase-like tetraheme cytochrome c subunit
MNRPLRFRDRPVRERLPALQEIPGQPRRDRFFPSITHWPLGLWIVLIAAAAFFGLGSVVTLARYTTSNPGFCLSCHGVGDTPDRGVRSLVHPGYDVVSCTDCHAKPGQIVFEGYIRGFLAEPERVSANCIRCHSEMTATNAQVGFKFDFLDIKITHNQHLSAGATCTTCHDDVAHDLRQPPTNRPRMEACFKCHSTSEACATCHQKTPPLIALAAVTAPQGGVTEGQAIYQRNCAGCHGSRGNWVTGVDLRATAFLDARSDQRLTSDIRQGVGSMPGFGRDWGGALTDDQIVAVVGYLRTAEGSAATPNARALYQSNCATCHGASGSKMPAVNLASRGFLDAQGSASLNLAISRGKGGMPPLSREMGGPLQPAEIRAVVDFLWSLSGGVASVDGRTLFAQHCAACHGPTGSLIVTSDLGSAAFLRQRTDAELVQITTEGQGAMPAFGGRKGTLTADQVQAIVSYMRSAAR